MDVCYIILGHKNPQHIKRLVEKLASVHASFYVHIDKCVDIRPFENELACFKNLTLLQKRESGTWGDIGIVKATLTALQEILKDRRSGYCVLLSGQDYLLRSALEIRDIFETGDGGSYADIWALPYANWYNGGLYRIRYYKYNVPFERDQYLLLPSLFSREFYHDTRRNVRRIATLLGNGIFPLRLLSLRRFPKMLKPYGGSQWWAITTEIAQDIISFVETNPSYLKFHRFTLLADEIFFQTLIVHFCKLKKIAVHPSLTYLRWETAGSAHPVTFGLAHVDELKKIRKENRGKPFARKFEANDPVLSLLDSLAE